MIQLVQLVRDLRASRTFWLAVVGLAGVAEEWARGSLTPHQALAAAFICLVTITQRHATAKLGRLNEAHEGDAA